LPALARTTEPR